MVGRVMSHQLPMQIKIILTSTLVYKLWPEILEREQCTPEEYLAKELTKYDHKPDELMPEILDRECSTIDIKGELLP
jgi:hypothetical protein